MYDESLSARTKRLLAQYGLRPRKGLAQNFLIDHGVLDVTMEAAQITSEDIVVEVGPGLGTLTRELAARAGRVIAIELDEKLTVLLRESLASFTNLTIINQDVLETDIAELLKSSGLEGKPYKLVANLPYYITQPVLRHFLESKVKPTLILVLMQKEVAQSIIAKPDDMSILAVSIQLYGKPKIIKKVAPGAFYPPPDVTSALLKIDVFPKPAVPVEIDSFFQLVRAGFCAARKQLANSISQGLGISKEETLAILEKGGIAPERRAETMSLEEWGKLWRAREDLNVK